MNANIGDVETAVRNSIVPLPDPRYWGPRFWFTMHTVAYFYPDHPTTTDMANAQNFFESLRTLLPCPGCSVHYTGLLQRFPVYAHLSSRMQLMQWVNTIHNEVNRRLHKPIMSFDEYLMHTRHLAQPPMFSTTNVAIGVAVVACVVAATAMVRARNHRSK